MYLSVHTVPDAATLSSIYLNWSCCMINFTAIVQLVIATSVAFVWIFRLDNIGKEFNEYRLPNVIRNLVGATKISLATLLVAGVWYPSLVFVPAVLMALLMVCALIAHASVRHAWPRYVPAFVLLLLSVYVSAAALGYGIR